MEANRYFSERFEGELEAASEGRRADEFWPEEARNGKVLRSDKMVEQVRSQGRTGPSCQPWATHDTSLTSMHISIEELAINLERAVLAAWPKRHDSRYSQVEVLLLRWADDDLGVLREISRLSHVFRDIYRYKVHVYEIPSVLPGKKLGQRVDGILEDDESQGKEKLLIVYYGGHAKKLSNSTGPPNWLANRRHDSPELPSALVQAKLEEAFEDVLLLYDCCYSAGVPSSGAFYGNKSVTEVIAACGYGDIAAEVDQHSFTNALIEVLAALSQTQPFSVGELHSRVLSRLKCWLPSLCQDEGGNTVRNPDGKLAYERQPRKTPVYSILCENETRRSIVLQPLAPVIGNVNHKADFGSSYTASTSGYAQDNGIREEPASKRKRILESPKFPQIIISVRLDKPELDISTWKEFLRGLPAEGQEIKVDGVWGSFSTLLLLRIPVAFWNLLEPNPACSFVGYVTSENKVADNSIPFNDIDSGDTLSPPYTIEEAYLALFGQPYKSPTSHGDDVDGTSSSGLLSSEFLDDLEILDLEPETLNTAPTIQQRPVGATTATQEKTTPIRPSEPQPKNPPPQEHPSGARRGYRISSSHPHGGRRRDQRENTTHAAPQQQSRARKGPLYTDESVWHCHECGRGGSMNPKINTHCTECNHKRCSDCGIESFKVPSYR